MPPAKPSTGNLREVDTTALLEQLRRMRTAAGAVETQLRRQSIHRAALEVFRAEIDEMAGLITGDRTYFHGKAHSMSMKWGGNES